MALRIIRLSRNPRRQGAAHGARGRRRRAVLQKATRPKYIIEVLHDRKGVLRFLYWTGAALNPNRGKAIKFDKMAKARTAARAVLARYGAQYRAARILPA